LIVKEILLIEYFEGAAWCIRCETIKTTQMIVKLLDKHHIHDAESNTDSALVITWKTHFRDYDLSVLISQKTNLRSLIHVLDINDINNANFIFRLNFQVTYLPRIKELKLMGLVSIPNSKAIYDYVHHNTWITKTM